MKTCGIICEYNPFHRGHLLQIKKIREMLGEDTAIVSLMSGNFTQRGSGAVCDRYLRAETAIKCGANLVLELPTPFCFGSAEHFAFGGVSVLNSLNCIDYICFGSENGDISVLSECAERMHSPLVTEMVKESTEISHQNASEKAFIEIYGEDAFYPTTPNDILACEYLYQLKKSGSKITPITYKRENGYSATESRKLLEGGFDVCGQMPTEAEIIVEEIVKNGLPNNDTLFSVASMMLDEEKAKLCYLNGGVYGRIKSVLSKCDGYESLVSEATCGRFSSSRIRRAILSLVLGVEADEMAKKPRVTYLLGCDEIGRNLLQIAKKKSEIEIVTKRTDIDDCLSEKADRLYALMTGKKYSDLITKHPFIKE